MTVNNGNEKTENQLKETPRESPLVPPTRKEFVEPEISQPVDVLEATTFFQAVDSGPTN